MKTRIGIRSQRGFTFIELMFAAIIIALATTVLISHLAINYRQSRAQRDRVFAFMVGKSILAEVQAFALVWEDSGAGSGSVTKNIDDLDDGITTNPTLSIAENGGSLVSPDHELSGNSRRDGRWVWSRQITVRPLNGVDNRKLRYVTVRIFKQDVDGEMREVANLSSIVNFLSHSVPATQVFDVYFLAIENIPGWWVHMETIRPFMEAMVTELEQNNPGLKFRTHWITKASYGRNQVYRPYINRDIDSHNETSGVYYYPGLMPVGNASTYYYAPGIIKGRMQTESGEINGYDPLLNPHPYALVDFFNHGMRYPQEKAYHDLRIQAVRERKAAIAAAEAAGTPAPADLWDMSEEPTYRMLLEDMCTNPDKYRNAMILNLHGELIPMPSIRNYSDPAKTPADLPGVRVVTHPEELRTKRDPVGTAHDDVVFRIYAWTTNPDTYSGPQVLPMSQPIALQIMGVNLTDGLGRLLPSVELNQLRGGVLMEGTLDYFDFAPAKHYDDPLFYANEMRYQASFVDPGPGKEKYTLITLYNTPVVAPAVVNSETGLQQGVANNNSARLYGMEYVPACTEASLDFSNNLASAGAGPKNTSRWTLRIPGSVLTGNRFVDNNGTPYNPSGDIRLTARTRILSSLMGSWSATGTTFPVLNEPENLSETYTWWADSPDDVPFTERSQFLGDPRHNPYKDLYAGDPDFPNGYNWCFDSLQNGVNAASEYPGLDPTRLRNRWQDNLRQDVGRYFELLRTALVRSGAVCNTLTGWSYYYMGHGAEIGYDAANGYPNSVPTILTPFGNDGINGFVNNITGSRRYVRASGANYWWGMPWLGELCPDSQYESQWLALDANGKISGNLTPGVGLDQFYQDMDQNVYSGSRNVTAGTSLLTAYQRLQSTGCAMFFNIGTSASTFNHKSASGNGDLVGPGLELADNYHLDLPASTTITRPFSLTVANNPDIWTYPPYSSNRYQASLIRTYYTSPAAGYTGSGLVELRSPDGSSSAFVVVNGLAETTTLGTGALAKYSLLTLLHSYFESGDVGLVNRIKMTPRVDLVYPTEITELANPISVDLHYDIQWLRWDGEKYTASTSPTFFETDGDIEYFLLYSKDNGITWLSILDDSPVDADARPANSALLLSDTTAGAEIYSWPTPVTRFPAGSYLVRVEVYRQGQSLHYSYHQRRIFIDR